MDGGNAISKILFLKARAMKKDAATLVASGPQGTVCSVIRQSFPPISSFVRSFIKVICICKVHMIG